MADGTVKIELDVDSSKAKANAKKEALDTGQQVGKNISSGVEDAAASTGTKAGAAIKSGVTSGSSGAGTDAGNAISQGVKSGTSGVGDAAGSQIRTGVLSKLSGISDDLGSIGSTMSLAITAPLLAIGTASFTTSMNFDTAMSQLAGALNEPIDQIDSLRQLAIKTGQDTIYSASDAGSAMIELAKGGLTDAQIEGGALASTMQLASAGNIQLSDSANTVVRAMGAFHLSASDTESAVNALAGSANASSADVSDISMALSQASAQAYSAGWSIQDTTAAIAELADSGIKGSDAGTSLKTMLQSLQAPSDTAAKVIEQLGLQVRDANGNMRPATEIVGELQSKLGGLSSAQRDAALQTIFGSDASRAALVLMNGGVSTYQKYTEATNDQTAAQRMADAQMGSSQKAIENMKGAIETAAISLGGALSPAVAHAADVVGDLASDFANLSDGQKDTIIKFALFAAAIGPVAKGISSVSDFAKTASDAINKLGGENTKLISASNLAKGAVAGLAIAGIAILASELIKAKDRYDNFNKATLGMEDAANKSSSSLQLQSSNITTLGSSAKQAAFDLDSFLKSQAGYVDAINSTNTSAQANITQLSQAKAVIDEYAGKTDLSTDAQISLKSAIEQVNAQCGTQLTVTDAANGVVYDSATAATVAADAVDKYIESKIRQIRVDALTEDLTNAYKAQQDAIKGVTAATDDYIQKKAEYEAAQEAAANGGEREKIALAGATFAYQAAASNLDKAKASRDSATASVQSFNTQLGISTQAAKDASDVYSNFITTHTEIAAAVERSGGSLTNFQGDLAKTGISTEQLNSLSSDQLTELGLKYDGTVGSITAKLWEFAGATEGPGADAAVKWRSGFDANTQGMIDSATSATGLTLAQFQLLSGQAGITGNDATAQFAIGIQNGGPASILAANNVAYSTEGGLHVTDGNSAGQNVINTYNQAIAAGDTYDQAMAKAQDAANALAAPDTASAGAGQIAKYSGGMDSQSGPLNDTSSGLAWVAKRPLYGLQDESYGWGGDLIQNFGTGMSGWFDWLGGQASEAANIVSSWLHQSTADVGPLKYTDQWGGDLIENIITDMASMDYALGQQSAKSAAIITSGFSPLQGLGFTVSGQAAVNYSMMYNKSMADNGTYIALNNLGAKFDRLMDSLPTTIKDNAGLSGRDFARAVSGVIR